MTWIVIVVKVENVTSGKGNVREENGAKAVESVSVWGEGQQQVTWDDPNTFAGIAFGGVLAVPGAMLGAGVGWVLAAYIRAFGWGDSKLRWLAGIGVVFAMTGVGVVIAAIVKDEQKDGGALWGTTGFGIFGVGVAVMGLGAFIADRLGQSRGSAKATKWCQLIFGIVGALKGMVAGVTPCVKSEGWAQTGDTNVGWVVPQKWCAPYAKKEVKSEKRPTGVPVDNQIDIPVNIFKHEWDPKEGNNATPVADVMKQLLPLIGLGVGLATGALTGSIVGCCVSAKKFREDVTYQGI